MLRLIYRLFVQRVQEIKAKRSAKNKNLANPNMRSRAKAKRVWTLFGAVLVILVGALILAYRWQGQSLFLDTHSEFAQLHVQVNNIDTSPVVLYLERWPPLLNEVPESDAVSRIVIRNNQFLPRFQLIPAGSLVEIINEDSILHNTHLDDGHNTVFNVATPLKSVTVQKKLSATGLLNVRCDLHPGMYSWVFVPPGPHYAVVERPDTVRWAQVPPGTYRLIAWQPEALSRQQEIELLPGKRHELEYQ